MVVEVHAPDEVSGEELLEAAEAYVRLFAREGAGPGYLETRLAEIRVEISRTGVYRQTEAEVAHGARVAWRNSNRCIGRLHWRSLLVLDRRHLHTPDEIFATCVDHLRVATNGGRIRPVNTVFAPKGPREPGMHLELPVGPLRRVPEC